MKKTRIVLVSLTLVGLCLAVFLAVLGYSLRVAYLRNRLVENLMSDRRQVYQELLERLNTPIDGATPLFVSKGMLADPRIFPDHPSLGEASIMHEGLRSGRWRYGTTFLLELKLDRKLLTPEKQHSSVTMAATVLLKDYFDGLGKIGFRAPNAPDGFGSDEFQRASFEWIRENKDYQFVVTAEAFVVPSLKRALIIGAVRESSPAR